jgi:hypothetical protein
LQKIVNKLINHREKIRNHEKIFYIMSHCDDIYGYEPPVIVSAPTNTLVFGFISIGSGKYVVVSQ